MRLIAPVFLSIALLAGCATAESRKMNQVSLGMTKQQVIEVLGPPLSTSAKSGVEYLNYRFAEPGRRADALSDAMKGLPRTDPTTPYYVRLIEGRVESYGRLGDFDSTKTPETKSTIDLNIKK